jgi:hypothetical protein
MTYIELQGLHWISWRPGFPFPLLCLSWEDFFGLLTGHREFGTLGLPFERACSQDQWATDRKPQLNLHSIQLLLIFILLPASAFPGKRKCQHAYSCHEIRKCLHSLSPTSSHVMRKSGQGSSCFLILILTRECESEEYHGQLRTGSMLPWPSAVLKFPPGAWVWSGLMPINEFRLISI